ncbi:MAG: hypothetical protein P4K98_07820 [Bryobacteraceae bacterium]|nr:hypothetical protein [Bryobacteraceae bacterium]
MLAIPATAQQLAGTWNISGTSTSGAQFSATAQISQQGAALAGSLAISGSGCAVSAAFSGSAGSDGVVQFDANWGGQHLILSGYLSGDVLSGAYLSPAGGCLNGDHGTWSANRASPASSFRIGEFSQIASGGGWETTLYIENPTALTVHPSLAFWADTGAALSLSVAANGSPNYSLLSTIAPTIAPYATYTLRTQAASTNALSGWVEVTGTAELRGYGVFHYTSPYGAQSEGTIPLEAGAQTSFVLPYDATSGFGMGVALTNLSTTQSVSVQATAINQDGVNIGSQIVGIPPNGHSSFQLTVLIPATVSTTGMVQLTCNSGSGVTGLGLRVSPQGGFTSVPRQGGLN